MAKINEKKPNKEASNTKVESTENKITKLDVILERLDRLEKENAELKGETNPEKKAKERYKWPRLMSYKMWWWEPVLNYEWFLKDPTKSDIYRKGDDWISNQYLEVELAWGKTVKVEVNEFGKFHTLSEKMEAKDENGKVITLWMEPESYTFNVWGKEFTVSPKCIN